MTVCIGESLALDIRLASGVKSVFCIGMFGLEVKMLESCGPSEVMTRHTLYVNQPSLTDIFFFDGSNNGHLAHTRIVDPLPVNENDVH